MERSSHMKEIGLDRDFGIDTSRKQRKRKAGTSFTRLKQR